MVEYYRTGFTPGSQAQVNAIDESIGGGFAQRFIEQPYQATEVFLVTQLSIAREFAISVVTTDEVNIGRKIEFASTQFAHSDNIQLHRIAVTLQRLTMLYRQMLLAGV